MLFLFFIIPFVLCAIRSDFYNTRILEDYIGYIMLLLKTLNKIQHCFILVAKYRVFIYEPHYDHNDLFF